MDPELARKNVRLGLALLAITLLLFAGSIAASRRALQRRSTSVAVGAGARPKSWPRAPRPPASTPHAFLTVGEEAAGEGSRSRSRTSSTPPASRRPTARRSSATTSRSETAEAVARLEAAGCVVVGKTNLHEFAYGITSENERYGDVVNPLDRSRIPGGSSGGLGRRARGRDVRRPRSGPTAAARSGSRRPAAASSASSRPRARLDRRRLPARADASTTPARWRARSPSARRDAALRPRSSSDRAATLEELQRGRRVARRSPRRSSVRRVEEAAAHSPAARPARASRCPEAVTPAFMREVADVHRELFAEHRDRYGPNVRTKIERCLAVPDEEERVPRRRAAYRRGRDAAKRSTASTSCSPRRSRSSRRRPARTSSSCAEHVIRLTLPFNALGWPVLALPAAPPSDGLPASVSLIGRPERDAPRARRGARAGAGPLTPFEGKRRALAACRQEDREHGPSSRCRFSSALLVAAPAASAARRAAEPARVPPRVRRDPGSARARTRARLPSPGTRSRARRATSSSSRSSRRSPRTRSSGRTNTLTAPLTTIPITLPWMTGSPYSFYARVRARPRRERPAGASVRLPPAVAGCARQPLERPEPAARAWSAGRRSKARPAYEVTFLYDLGGGEKKLLRPPRRRPTCASTTRSTTTLHGPRSDRSSGACARCARSTGKTSNHVPAVSYGALEPYVPTDDPPIAHATVVSGSSAISRSRTSDISSRIPRRRRLRTSSSLGSGGTADTSLDGLGALPACRFARSASRARSSTSTSSRTRTA